MTDLSDCPDIQLPQEGRDDLRRRLEASRNGHQDLAHQDRNSDQGVQALFQAEIEHCLIERLEVGQDELGVRSPFNIILSHQSAVSRYLSAGQLVLFKQAWRQASDEVSGWVPPWVQAQ